MKRSIRMVALAVAVVGVVSACSRKQPPAEPQPDRPVTNTPPQTTQPTPTTTTPPTTNADAEREAERRRMMGVLEQVVHFDYDDATIRTDAQELLAAKVPILRGNTAIRMRVEGHADERGSVEYNLALGMRRANAVRDYLVGFGLDADRFQVTSMGEDRPMVQGTGDAAWSQNRRAEFRVTGGM